MFLVLMQNYSHFDAKLLILVDVEHSFGNHVSCIGIATTLLLQEVVFSAM
jgi:hypothetical protein